MEEYKLKNYKQDHGAELSGFKPLYEYQSNGLISEMLTTFSLSSKFDNLFYEISNKFKNKDFDEEFTYNITSIFECCCFEITDEIYVIWSPKNIDQFETKVLIDKWSDIWYGISDEAVILFNKKSLIMITHYGRIYYS